MTWTAFAILAMFLYVTSRLKSRKVIVWQKRGGGLKLFGQCPYTRINTFQKGAHGTFIFICLNQRQIVLIIFIEIIFFLFHLHRRLTGIQCSSHFSRSSSKSQFTNWGVILTSQLINCGTRLRRQLINWGTRLRRHLMNWGTILRSQSANLSHSCKRRKN